MLDIDKYKNMSIPEDYNLHVFDVMDLFKNCKDENKNWNVTDAIRLAFRIGFDNGKRYQINNQEFKERIKYEQMDRIFLGKFWNYHPLKIEKVFLLKKLKTFSKQEGFKRVRVCTIT